MTKDLIKRSEGFNLPSKFKILGTENGSLKVKRPDNLIIFLNERDSHIINQIKIHAKFKKDVIVATGIYRGMQISNNYSRKYTKDKTDYTNIFKVLLERNDIKKLN